MNAKKTISAPQPTNDDASKDEQKTFAYKGEVVDVISLVNADMAACEIPEVQVAAIKTAGWGGQEATKLPKLLVVTKIQESPLGKKLCLVSYTSYLGKQQFQNRSINLPNDFKVKKLTGAQAKKMIAAYQKSEFDNLYQNLGHDFMVGSEPEIFVEDKDGKIIPAFNFLGSKEQKNNMTPQKCGVYWDGPSAEFQTVSGGCLSYHADSIQEGLEAVYKAAKVVDSNAKPSIKSVMEIGYDVLNSAKAEQIAIGSMSSKNIYNLKEKEVALRALPFRSAGGNLHFGIGKKNEDKKQVDQMIRAMDSILAVCCVSLFAKYDNPIHRQFQNIVGEYRTPKHGLEYRVLSNAWLCHPMIAHLVIDLARKCLVFGEKGFMTYWNSTEEETINCVQNCDVELAHNIMERNRATILKIFRAAYSYLTEKQLENAYRIFYDGVDTAIKNPADIVGNWKLDGGWINHSGAAGSTCNVGTQHTVTAKKA